MLGRHQGHCASLLQGPRKVKPQIPTPALSSRLVHVPLIIYSLPQKDLITFSGGQENS